RVGPPTAFEHLVGGVHLRWAERALDVGEAKVETEVVILGEQEAAARLVPLVVGRGRAMIPERRDYRCELLARRRDHAALTGRDRLARVKTEGAGVAERPGVAPAIPAAEGAGAVLEHPEPPGTRKVEYRVEVGAQPEQMHGDNP